MTSENAEEKALQRCKTWEQVKTDRALKDLAMLLAQEDEDQRLRSALRITSILADLSGTVAALHVQVRDLKSKLWQIDKLANDWSESDGVEANCGYEVFDIIWPVD